jgi:hypothetical protein
MIPCIEFSCLKLPACRYKEEIDCELLCDYMQDEHTRIVRSNRYQNEKAWQFVWDKVETCLTKIRTVGSDVSITTTM